MEKVRYMISDAADIVNVESHVLRYWEDELELTIPRNELGHRYYTKENIQEFQRIKELKEQGYQLKAIRMIVHNKPLSEEADVKLLNGASTASMSTAASTSTAASATMPSGSSMETEKTQLPQARETETPQSVLDNTDKMAQFTELMTEIVGKAIAANNEELSKNISEDVGEQVIKEMNYLMREREEAEEERFRNLDAAIRGNLKKKEPGKKKWLKKKPSQA